MTIKKIYLNRIVSDEELKSAKGTFLDSGHVHHFINYDCDIYDESTREFICSYRKKRIKTSHKAWNNYRHLSVASRGRGASAGPIDPASVYWKKRQLIKTSGFKTSYIVNGKVSKMTVNNQVASTPIGFFEKTKALGIDKPCRLTFHTSQSLKEYENGKPYIHELDHWFKQSKSAT